MKTATIKPTTEYRRKARKLTALLCAIVAVFYALSFSSHIGSAPAEFEQAIVVRVVDGDTLVVDRGQGDERLRLIGIDAPESVHPDASRNTEAGVTASSHLKSTLSPGTVVWLQTDTSDTDRYDRLLRYVWLEAPEDPANPSEVAEKMLNAILVSDGYAEAKEYPPDTMYANVFEQL